MCQKWLHFDKILLVFSIQQKKIGYLACACVNVENVIYSQHSFDQQIRNIHQCWQMNLTKKKKQVIETNKLVVIIVGEVQVLLVNENHKHTSHTNI